MEKLKVGDVVQLTSGGPPMTIETIEGDKAMCVWFSTDDSHVIRQMFALDQLKVCQPRPNIFPTTSAT